ncbi:MAG TPA: polysaccharide biosynthesis tyrosine autokinase [Ignavibacteriaceae bacterium]|nr:polysaccharide biosynthesis tyrosine autokinase [Ignavibacteriaceae bacterium]
MDNGKRKEMIKTDSNESQTSIDAIILAFDKRKIVLFILFIVVFVFGFIFYLSQTPIYESTILLKKESQPKQQNMQDQYNKMVADQSLDDIETELQLINTRVVLSKVVKKLNLNFHVDKIQFPDKEEIDVDKSLTAYNWWLNNQEINKTNYPEVLDAKSDSNSNNNGKYYVLNTGGYLELYKAETNTLINSIRAGNSAEIKSDNFYLKIDWHNAPSNTKLFFSVHSTTYSTNHLNKKIKVVQVNKTNIIEIRVQDKSPKMAQLIANTLTEKFRETRTENARQNVQDSYKFVDKQLKEMAQQLKDAEDKVSAYKSKSGITQLDKNSEEITKFLSGLQAQKIANDLELSKYESMEKGIQDDYKKEGFFDQTFLAPDKSSQSNSPFSAILKQLSDLEQKKIIELQKKNENHPDIINLNSQISQLKDKLKSYNQNTLASYKIIISSLKEKQANLDKLIARYQSRINYLPKEEMQLAELTRKAEVAEKMFNVLLDKREEMRIKEISQLQDILIVDSASLPTSPTSPSLKIIILVCFFIWGAFSIGLVFLGEFKERRLLKLSEIEDVLQLPILSIIPKFPKELVQKINKSTVLEDKFAVLKKDKLGVIEAYKVLQIKLGFTLKSNSKIILFTSAEEHSGKTTIVANLAATLTAADKKVLIIDADLKRCGLTDLFRVSRENNGLSTFLSEDLDKLPIYSLTGFSSQLSQKGLISILPSGEISEKSSNLLQSQKAVDLINDLKSSFYDYILIDTPPVNRVIDTLILSRLVENIIMVTRYNYTLRDTIISGVQELRNEKINISGAIVNACEIEKTSFKDKYGYGYGYEYSYENKNGKSKSHKEKQTVIEKFKISKILNLW